MDTRRECIIANFDWNDEKYLLRMAEKGALGEPWKINSAVVDKSSRLKERANSNETN
ncbi:MAG: hypothetical protein CFH41_01653 [Alphaproteobacteria bacterium MarineAlpha11_Bin1]|nr:MAG: hypothetical protein CFH41_01653 [Alphaproteobacteria bacterium MarineAlpha11_Bin1]|tara:strand:- start:1771 stop:1941 length:171 start_codon:yes stop_codon:yes gene_type:complete